MIPSVSVIIPSYNSRAYIEECLESALQTLPDASAEILVVDDGSEDDTCDIVTRFHERDSRISVRHILHAGQSVARNFGLNHSKGKYVYFLDSDDLLPPDVLTKMMTEMERYPETDILQSQFIFFRKEKNGKESRYNVRKSFPRPVLRGEDIIRDALNCGQLLTHHSAKLYRRSFLERNSILFPEGEINEDTYFSLIAALKAREVRFLEIPGCLSREREGSESRKDFQRLLLSMHRIMMKVGKQIFPTHPHLESLWKARYVRSLLYNLLQSSQRQSYRNFLQDYYCCKKMTMYRTFSQNPHINSHLPRLHRSALYLSRFPLLFYHTSRLLSHLSFRMH